VNVAVIAGASRAMIRPCRARVVLVFRPQCIGQLLAEPSGFLSPGREQLRKPDDAAEDWAVVVHHMGSG